MGRSLLCVEGRSQPLRRFAPPPHKWGGAFLVRKWGGAGFVRKWGGPIRNHEGDLSRAQNRGVSRRVLLASTMEEAYTRLLDRLDGITDDEFFWQPVPDAWTIYEDRPGHWTYNYEIPDPDPAPM